MATSSSNTNPGNLICKHCGLHATSKCPQCRTVFMTDLPLYCQLIWGPFVSGRYDEKEKAIHLRVECTSVDKIDDAMSALDALFALRRPATGGLDLPFGQINLEGGAKVSESDIAGPIQEGGRPEEQIEEQITPTWKQLLCTHQWEWMAGSSSSIGCSCNASCHV